MGFWSKHDKLESRLRAERPRPSDDLVNSIKGDLADAKRAPRRGLRPQLRLAGITAALFAGLLVIGGAGYAMTSINSVIETVTFHTFVTHRAVVHTVVMNAANAEYGTTTTQTTTTTATTTSATTTTTGAGGGQEVKTEAKPNTPGTLTLSLPGVAASSAAVTWAASSFGGQAVTATATAVSGATVGQSQGSSTQQVVAITVTDPATGQPIHQLSAPIEITFNNVHASYVPALSEDGVNYRQLSRLSSPNLPDGQQDGYYRSCPAPTTAGEAQDPPHCTVNIFTRHLTSFAILYKANLAQSESGRKTAPAGSGKFGDPTRIHTGAPKVDVPVSPTASGSSVGFSFFVDEQAAVYVHVLSGSNELVLGNSSTIRSHKIGGKSRKTFHLVILRPGLIKMNLHVPGVKPGAKVQLTFVDFDGNKVSKTVTVK